jgi:hypothetical protein
VLNSLKIKALIILSVITSLASTFLLVHHLNNRGKDSGMAEDLWRLVQSPTVSAEKVTAFSKDFPAGFKDASMGKLSGPVKVEGG